MKCFQIDESGYTGFELLNLTLPLNLQSVTQVDSRHSPAVQVADVMIGAAIKAPNTLKGQRAGALDAEEVIALYADHQLIHMLPSIDFGQQIAKPRTRL